MTYRQDSSSPGCSDGSPRVGAVLLAAGESTRFGDKNKLLAEIHGDPIVRHATEPLCTAIPGEVVAVVGHDETAVRACLDDLPVSFRSNPAYEAGQSTSVRAGVREARARDWVGTVFVLGDMPFISPDSIDALVKNYVDGAGSILAAAYEGTRGNPVLFDEKHYETLTDVTGDVGGRQLVETHPESALVETNDPGVLRDIDEQSDLSSE